MKLLVISDLHLGNNDNFDTFGWSDENFLVVVMHIMTLYQVDQVVLNGDVFELYKYSFSDVYRRHQEIISFFKSIDAIFIKGNHDFVSPLGKQHHTIVNPHGKRIYIEHGHEADFMNGTGVGRSIGVVLHRLLKCIFGFKLVERIYFKAINSLEDVNKQPRKYNTYRYLKYALRLLRSYDVVVLSHTHKVESHSTYYLNRKKFYSNSGSCTLGRFQGVVVDAETLKCETIKMAKTECEAIVERYIKSSSINIA